MRALLLLCTLLAAAQALHSVPPQQPGGQPASEVPGQSVQWRKSVAGADCQRVCAARTRAWPAELRTPVGGVPDGYLCASRGIYGAAAANRADAPCLLSDGHDAPAGQFMCACVDCAGGGLGCQQRGWSSACGGDAPCRVDINADGIREFGTVLGGVCVHRSGGAAMNFEQLCTPGGAAPR